MLNYSKENGISIILQKKNIVLARTDLDITDKIIERKVINFLDAFIRLKKFSKNTFVFSNGHDGQILKKNLYYNKSKF